MNTGKVDYEAGYLYNRVAILMAAWISVKPIVSFISFNAGYDIDILGSGYSNSKNCCPFQPFIKVLEVTTYLKSFSIH